MNICHGSTLSLKRAIGVALLVVLSAPGVLTVLSPIGMAFGATPGQGAAQPHVVASASVQGAPGVRAD